MHLFNINIGLYNVVKTNNGFDVNFLPLVEECLSKWPNQRGVIDQTLHNVKTHLNVLPDLVSPDLVAMTVQNSIETDFALSEPFRRVCTFFGVRFNVGF